jgi:H+/Cl- antiporter ClcA
MLIAGQNGGGVETAIPEACTTLPTQGTYNNILITLESLRQGAMMADVNSTRTRTARLIVAVLTLGMAIGIAAGLLSQMLYGVEYLAFGYTESSSLPGPFTVPALRRIAGVVGGSLIAATIWWLLRTKSTRVPSVKKAVNGETMPVWQTTVHVLLQILIVGSGSSIGREVAPREFGAMLGQRFSGVIGFTGADKRMLVAVCAGAGLAGVYDAPLAGLFFTVEILLADVTLEKVAVSLGMSATAAYVASLIKGQKVFYHLPGLLHENTPTLMLFALVGGVVFGALGALFRLGSQWAEKGPRNDAGILWKMPAAALLTGVVAIWIPQVMGNGRASAQLSFDVSLISNLAKGQGLSLFGTSVGQPLVVTLVVLTISLIAKALVTLDYDTFRRVGRRAAAGHRAGCHSRRAAWPAVDARIPRGFDSYCGMRAGRRCGAAFGLAAGSADGDVPGDGAVRGPDIVFRAGRAGFGGCCGRLALGAETLQCRLFSQ